MCRIRTEGLVCHGLRYEAMEIEAGEIVFLAGPSGSGKTTLLRLINGTRTPTAGEVFIDGAPLRAVDKLTLRRRVVMAGQEVFLFPGTVRENMERFHSFHGTPCPSDAEIRKYLSICSSPADVEQETAGLSGGERQRIFLAAALSLAGDTLLLDEPTSALDAALADGMMGRLCGWARERGMTMVIVSHDEMLARTWGDRIIRIGGEM